MVNKTVVSSPDHFLGLAPRGRLVKAERVADEKMYSFTVDGCCCEIMGLN